MALAPAGNDRLLTIREVSDLTRLSVGTLYRFVSEQRIPVVHLSRRCIRFRLSDLHRWIEEHTQDACQDSSIDRMYRGADDQSDQGRFVSKHSKLANQEKI